MALYLHSSHLKFGFIAKSWLPVCFSFYRVFFVVIWHNAGYDYLRRQMRAHTALGQCTEHECYGIGITILQTNAKLVHNGCTTLHVFFQCSRKAPETQNSQRYRFPFVMLVSHVLSPAPEFRETSQIREISGNSTENSTDFLCYFQNCWKTPPKAYNCYQKV